MNNKKWIRTLFTAALMAVLAGCDISGTGGPSRDSDGDSSGEQTPAEGQAVLGPIVGATVTIRDIEDINTIACSATTTDNSDLAKAGAISFGKPCIFKNHLYMLTVTGGDDVDFDDNGERDATPTPNSGEFRALLTGDQLLQNNWKTNILTESIYQALQYSLDQAPQNGKALDGAAALAIVDNLATQLIKQDLNGDGVINHFDIAQWHPQLDGDAAINAGKARFATELIHDKLNRTLTQIPATESIVGRIDTRAPARQVLSYKDDLLVTTDTSLLVYGYHNGESILLSNLALGWVYDMTLVGDELYVALGENGIAQIDLHTLQITRRWNTRAERITSLQQRVVFSALLEDGGHSLMALTDSGEIQQILLLTGDGNPALTELFKGPAMLKTVGDVIYWSPGFTFRRFVLRDGELHQLGEILPSLTFPFGDTGDANTADNFFKRRALDLEVINNRIYAVAEGVIYEDYFSLANLYPMAHSSPLWDLLLQNALKRRIYIIDISQQDSPVDIASIAMDDIDSLLSIGADIVALGKNDVSLRDADTLRPLSSLPLPSTFSGFDPAKGLERFQGTIAIAAKENGILLVDPSLIPIKRFYGKVIADTPVSQATVTVRSFPQDEITCTKTSTDDGSVAITPDCVRAEAWYHLEAKGGTRNIDGQQVPFTGSLNSIMHKSDFIELDEHWHISTLTELAWQTLLPSFQAGATMPKHGLEDIAAWWFGLQSTEFSSFAPVDQIYRWPQLTDYNALQFDFGTWLIVIDETAKGHWPSDALFRLTGASDFRIFDESIIGAAVTGDVIALQHANSIELLKAQRPFTKLGSINTSTSAMAVKGDKVVSIDERQAVAYVFDIGDPANAALTGTVRLVGMETIPYTYNTCVTANTVYKLTSEPDDATRHVTAWRLESGTTSPPLQYAPAVSSAEPKSYWCSDDRIIVQQKSGVFDVLQLTTVGLQKVASIATPTGKFVTSATLSGNDFFYSASNDSTSVRYHLSIDNNGVVNTITELHVDNDHPGQHFVGNMLFDDILFGDDYLYLFTSYDALVLNAQSLETVQRFRLPLSPFFDTLATPDAMLILRPYEHSFWRFSKPAVAP